MEAQPLNWLLERANGLSRKWQDRSIENCRILSFQKTTVSYFFRKHDMTSWQGLGDYLSGSLFLLMAGVNRTEDAVDDNAVDPLVLDYGTLLSDLIIVDVRDEIAIDYHA